MQPLIEFKNVSKSFKKASILSGINLSIEQGDLFGLIGVSGAGKTTLLRTLIGFYKADQGQILFQEKDISQNIKLIKKIFGFTSQDYSFYERLTPDENLKYFGKLYGMSKSEIKSRSDELLELVELTDHRKKLAKTLSGGMQRRLDVACSLMHSPQILILDEPTTGLDPVLKKHMLKLIKKINDAGTTILISSHLLGEIEHVCNKVAIIHNGKILVENTPDKLKEMYSRNEEIHLETFPAEYEEVLKLLKKQKIHIAYSKIEEHRLVIYTPQAEKTLRIILDILEHLNETLLDVVVNKPSLAEVFEALTQKPATTKVNAYEELKANIRSALEHRYSKEEIKKELIKGGYKERIVKKVLSDIK